MKVWRVAVALAWAAASAGAQDLEQWLDLVPSGIVAEQASAIQCVGGAIADDGTFENGFRFNFSPDSRFAQRFTPPFYPALLKQVCTCWKAATQGVLLNYLVNAYDDNGPGGQPGTQLGSKFATVSIPFPFGQAWTDTVCADLNIQITSGSVYVGPQWNSEADIDAFVCDDETPTTPLATFYSSTSGGAIWSFVPLQKPNARAMGIRAEFEPVAPTVDPPHPNVPAITSTEFPEFRFWAQFGGNRAGQKTTTCLPLSVCIANTSPTRAETFVRIIGPRPNGYLWVQIAKFNLNLTEVWIEQISSGDVKYYKFDTLSEDSDAIPGLVDREGFLP
jgi:hypothetical protein